MKKFARIILCISVLLFTIILQSATTSAEISDNVLLKEQPYPPGLQELTLNGQSIFGVFEFDGTRVFLETRRGEMISGARRIMDPTAPLFEIDLRISDENGFPFFIQTGGHGPIDEDWISPLEPFQDENIIVEQEASADNLLNCAAKMIEALSRIEFRSDLIPEHRAAMNILPIIKSAMSADESSDESYEDVQSSSSLAHSIEIWRKNFLFTGNILGDHSGTIAKTIVNGSACQIWSACNHGTCPGSGMAKKCSKTFTNRTGFCQPPPMCSSAYGFLPGQHICNDDSYIQYYRIRNNANPNINGGTCSDNGLRQYAPDCW
ncbi:MAG: hypothetical protein NTZ97_00635 [Candidatus Moranbacteria bacterium]|nr:hypothetical protein [Candidatus Moranbacteria bacterium]